MPMGFCYPGKGKSGDLPPRRECAPLWHERMLATLTDCRLTLLVGSYAQAHYLETGNLTERCETSAGTGRAFSRCRIRRGAVAIWIKRNPWFETDVLPALRRAVRKALGGSKNEGSDLPRRRHRRRHPARAGAGAGPGRWSRRWPAASAARTCMPPSTPIAWSR